MTTIIKTEKKCLCIESCVFSVNCKNSIEIYCELVAIYGGHVIK